MGTHWKRLVNPDYLGAYSLDGKDRILTIGGVAVETVVGPNGKKEDCPVCRFRENEKPMILNRTNMKMIEKIYKTPIIENWAGKQIQIYPTTTKFGGDVVECLRIRPFAPKQEAIPPCDECGCVIEAFGKMSTAQLADYTLKKYGRALCGDCATIAAEAQKAQAAQNDALAAPENMEKPEEEAHEDHQD